MANKIVLKKTSTASKVPLATDLEVGEIAVNLADQKLYSKNAGGTVVLVGSGLGGSGTVTSVAATAGTGISVSGSPITASGTLTITNTAPDLTVAFTNGTGISVTGTYPNFTVTNTAPSSGGTVTSVSGTAPISVATGTSTPAISISQATTSTNGYLSSTDWNTFNGKQPAGSYVTLGGALGTPSSGTLTNCTFPTLNQNTTGSSGSCTGNSATATTATNFAGIPTGTAMLFQQTAAPTGWTKVTTNDNAALRVVSGTAGTGGTVGFTTAFASQAVSGSVATTGSTTATGSVATVTGSVSTSITGVSGSVSTSTSTGNTYLNDPWYMPSHAHTIGIGNNGSIVGNNADWAFGSSVTHSFGSNAPYGHTPCNYDGLSFYAGSSGYHSHSASSSSSFSFSSGTASSSFSGSAPTFTGTAHTHASGAFTGTAINLAVKYVDVIVATKN